MYNYVRARMSDSDAAEDVVSEAYLRAARAFGTFDPGRAKFSTWVTKIAVNCMNSHYRKVRPTTSLDEAPASVFAIPDAQEQYANEDLVGLLLGQLDPIERNLVVMKYREGYRNVDIAKELDMNASTVSTVLARALEKMRSAIEKGEAHG